ncbi:MAG: hypothetical protein ACRCZE_00330 [Candidatus Altimarinota bacterium]
MPTNSPSLIEIPSEFTSKNGDLIDFSKLAADFSSDSSYDLTREYLHLHQNLAESGQELNENQVKILLLASITHGRVESIMNSRDDYSSANSLEKERAVERHQRLATELVKHLSSEEITGIVEAVFNKTSKLSEIFTSIPSISPLRTAIKAWVGAGNSISPQVEKLVFDIFSDQLTLLIEKSANQPVLKNYLNSKQAEITEIMEKMPLSVLGSHLNNQTSKAKQFSHAAYLWRQFLTPTTAGQQPWQEVPFDKDNSKDIVAQ